MINELSSVVTNSEETKDLTNRPKCRLQAERESLY